MENSATPVIIAAVAAWVERVVIGLNLCPFARLPAQAGAIRYKVTMADDPQQLLESLSTELQHLDEHAEIQTTLLIHPYVLQDFSDYNAFLTLSDQLISSTGREGIYQLASFHPDYQFAGTRPADAENYSNRSPYPMLHLLREQSVSSAVASHPDVHRIPERNVALLNEMGSAELAAMLSGCLAAGADGTCDQ